MTISSLAELVQVLHQVIVQDVLGLALGGAVDVDLGFDDRHEAGRGDLAADVELLLDDGFDAGRVGVLDDRAHLGAEDLGSFRLPEQFVELPAWAS